ncbi:MAG: single-stranded DNA-binding protein [Bacilli bacterium]|nr:single-stranded DNA-binding protein [Bacilli bacterium]
MLNHVVLVGRLAADPELKVLESGLTVCTVTLAVNRSFKELNGDLETDFIKCTLWEGIATASAEYCKKGSIIGVKGRLATRDYVFGEGEEKKKFKIIEVIAERVSFIKV